MLSSAAAIVPEELGCVMRRQGEGRSGGDGVICLQSEFFFHLTLLCPKQRGLERENVTGFSWGKVIYCSLSAELIAQDRTLECPQCPEPSANDALQLVQGQQRWREANTCMYLYHRSSNRCAQTNRCIDTHSCKETRYINWNIQHEVSWPFFSLPRGLLVHNCILLMLEPVEVDSGASCWSGQFRATIYRLTTLQFQLPEGWARSRRTNICRHLNSCNPSYKHTQMTNCALWKASAVDLSCCSLAVRTLPCEVIPRSCLTTRWDRCNVYPH